MFKFGIINVLGIFYEWYDFGVVRSKGHKVQKHLKGDRVAGVSYE